MNKKLFLLFIFALWLSSCGKKGAFLLEGNIKDLPSDTIWVCYQVPTYKLDTLIADKGKFTYTFVPDTFTVFSLLQPEIELGTFFADKGEKITLDGSIGQLQVKGTGENKKLVQILQHLDKVKTEGRDILDVVDSLVKSDPQSYTNIYLIDTYYARDTLPDYKKIDELVNGLSGIIKDTPYFIGLRDKLDEFLKSAELRSLPVLSCKDKDGKTINWSDVKDRYVLLDFWASWNEKSIAAQDSLEDVRKALKKEKFIVISVSLDLNRDEWLAASQRDTTQWKQVCDFKGWNNALVKQLGITRLPSNVLVDPDKKIVARDIRGKELMERVKELLASDNEKEKTTKVTEKKRIRKNKN